MKNLSERLKSIVEEDEEYEDSEDKGDPGPEDDFLYDDPMVGETINDIELTAKGIHNHNDGFWYFPKFLRNADGEPKGDDGVYWYKKKRKGKDEEVGGKPSKGHVEEYIGPSTDEIPFKIPTEFMPHIKKLEAWVANKKSQPVQKHED